MVPTMHYQKQTKQLQCPSIMSMDCFQLMYQKRIKRCICSPRLHFPCKIGKQITGNKSVKRAIFVFRAGSATVVALCYLFLLLHATESTKMILNNQEGRMITLHYKQPNDLELLGWRQIYTLYLVFQGYFHLLHVCRVIQM